jgi:hypothetical protein
LLRKPVPAHRCEVSEVCRVVARRDEDGSLGLLQQGLPKLMKFAHIRPGPAFAKRRL